MLTLVTNILINLLFQFSMQAQFVNDLSNRVIFLRVHSRIEMSLCKCNKFNFFSQELSSWTNTFTIVILTRSNKFYNFFDKLFNLDIFCSFVLTVVLTIILLVIIIIILRILNVNVVATQISRAILVRIIRYINITVLLTRKNRVILFVVNARFVDIFYDIIVFLSVVVLSDRSFAVAIMIVS